ncbi:iron complex transport system permease protein [Gordonia malaquae]|uniref:Putative ABC transporter permease protein n=1 Tax=Gordonia malaquae NBRC 108250 TaxID=1223542 RepID=M3VBR7_GORML|nr:iron ABC transporter permease [Gordonia malaquae]GAC80733.1 putative ABC transporter permease protein [Gordonia malaquae NBRC 108250]SED49298.1 iron complex transport system permease protein [Gordonia malaquae]
MTATLDVGHRPLRRNVIRAGLVSVIVRPRAVVVGLVLAASVAALGFGLLYIETLPPDVVTKALFGGGGRLPRQAIVDGQLPIVLLGAFAGAGLAVAGANMQTVARNPLATPDMLGITAGASTMVVLAIAFAGSWGAWFDGIGVPGAALVGAAGTALAMYALAWKNGLETTRLVLVGVAATWFFTALTSYLLTRAQVWEVEEAQRWIVGSLSGASWDTLTPVLVVVPIGIVASLLLRARLAAISMGEDLARSFGTRPALTTGVTMAIGVVVAGVAVSGVGPIAFVALLAPQIALRVAGGTVPGPLTSGLCGALLVLLSELLCRTVLPSSIPVGVVTAGVGGPVLVASLVIAKMKGRL